VARTLREIGAVQARPVHAHEHFAVFRHRVRSSLDDELLVGNHERAHAKNLMGSSNRS
jgi:hypothetical protein